MDRSNDLIIFYDKTQISHEKLEVFLQNNDIDPYVLGNVVLIPETVKAEFCNTFNVVFVEDEITAEKKEDIDNWLSNNIKNNYNTHLEIKEGFSISKNYVVFEDKGDLLQFKLVFG